MRTKKPNPERLGFIFSLLIGCVFFPLFGILDVIVYPDHVWTLFAIRSAGVALFVLFYFLSTIAPVRFLFVFILAAFFVAGFGISLMCYVVGEGFASGYYAGNLLVLITASLFVRISLARFLILIGSVVAQHFLLLSRLPFAWRDFMVHLFFFGSSALISVITRQVVSNLVKENSLLRDFLPICANCKKIRDDRGYWHRVESYIEEHSTVEFTHGVCPSCAMEYHRRIDLIAKEKAERKKTGDEGT